MGPLMKKHFCGMSGATKIEMITEMNEPPSLIPGVCCKPHMEFHKTEWFEKEMVKTQNR